MSLRIAISLFVALDLHAASRIASLRLIRELAISAQTDTPQASYARDDRYEYLGTPDGLYRAERIASAPLERRAFAGETINAIAADGGALFVSRGLPHFSIWPEPTLLRSRDHGVTFEPAGAGLRSCVIAAECGYLIPKQLAFAPGRLFVSAGGNVLVSGDDGTTWARLFGVGSGADPEPQLCPVTFERIGERMILGGECPLDIGYLASGTLRPDLLGWAAEPVRLVAPDVAPDMENRNVQFIRGIGNDVVYAGIEGALLKSTDGGATFRYVIHYDIEDSASYPYIGQFIASSRHAGLLAIAGFDKATMRGYLAYSSDAGESWTNLSPLVADTGIVSLLAEDAEGRLLAVTYAEGRLLLAELVIESFGKRRSARH